MRPVLSSFSAILVATGLLTPSNASAQQSVNLFIGGFVPRSFDARGSGSGTDDVLVQDSILLSTFNRSSGIDIGQFKNVTVGGEWLAALGNYFEAGLGLGVYQKSVRTSYTEY